MKSLVQSAVHHSIIEKEMGENSKTDDFADATNPRIVVMGCGGAGNNTVKRLYTLGITGAELIAINTDKVHLSTVPEGVKKILIGQKLTRGLGAGGFPTIGRNAAEVSRATLTEALENADLVFICAGMGGGTGTGSAPVVAEIAKANGAIVIAMVTYPFAMERLRLAKAEAGIAELRKKADTVVIIDNNRLVEFCPNLPMDQALAVADELVARAIKGITQTISEPSLINLDYADVRAIMSQGGVAMIMIGEAGGADRVNAVVKDTMENYLLDVDYAGATGALIHMTGGADFTLGEASRIGEMLTENMDPHANVIWGARIDPAMEGKVLVICIMTGVNSPQILGASASEVSAEGERAVATGGVFDLGLDYIGSK